MLEGLPDKVADDCLEIVQRNLKMNLQESVFLLSMRLALNSRM